MTPLDPDIMQIGMIVTDTTGREWVYLGYASRANLPFVHRFALTSQGNALTTPQWVYDAVNIETIIKKFPDLEGYLNP